ncbi:MAG TPA: DeoR/GlpR family DNA-binding transcription regulator [Dermatophilaceae bacterium]|nr:DeoR/GlpR family DNA-binding transcription regulator [Dermatophilaceae bacterium]
MRYDSAPARRRMILEALRESGFVSVADLTRDLGVSDMTVRRDLRKLEERGEVRVRRGGVSALHGPLHNAAFTGRANLDAAAKRAIAERARDLVQPRDSIAIDAGTTTYALAQALPDTFAGTVVTHSIPVMQLLLNRGAGRVVGLGGELLVESQAFAGQMTVDAAAGLRVRVLFLGAAAVDERGVYVATDNERPTKLALIGIADQVVLLADHTKFAASAPVLLCPHDSVTTLVTDAGPPPAIAEQLGRTGTEVLLAG